MGALYITIILLLLCVIVLLIVKGLQNRKPKKILNDFEKKIVDMSDELMRDRLCSSELRRVSFLEAAVERDEQSETLFIDCVKTYDNIHITKYIWHYGIMLYNILDYKYKLHKTKYDAFTIKKIEAALDEYKDSLINIIRFILEQKEAYKAAAVVYNAMETFEFEKRLIITADNSAGRSLRASFNIIDKVYDFKVKDISDEDILYGALWFGRANFIEGYGYKRLRDEAARRDSTVVISYSLIDNDIEMLVATEDIMNFGYIYIEYKTQNSTTKFSTDGDDFIKYLKKNAKTLIVKNSI